MVKNIVQYLISIVLTVIITACLAIPMTTTFGVIVSLILVQLLVGAACDHIVDKTMPKIVQWVQYGLELVSLILFACGFAYTNTYCLIFAIIALVIALICAVLARKTTPMVMDPETPAEGETSVEENVTEETAETATEEVPAEETEKTE